MPALYSPTIRSLSLGGLSCLLFKSEERRDLFSASEHEKKNLVQILHKGQTSPHTSRVPSPSQYKTPSTPTGHTFNPRIAESKDNPIQNRTGSFGSTHVAQGAVRDGNSPSTQMQEQPKSNKNETLAFEDWPKEWITLYKRFGLPHGENSGSQIRIAWTYAGLEQDVLGVINKQRQEVIRKLTVELNHRKGTHNFIPFSFVAGDNSSQLATYQNISFFWSAMRLVRPRVLLIFGSVARNALNMPKILLPLQKIDMGALQVLQMHKPETLAEDSDHYAKALGFLQEYLRFCPKKEKD